jgi:hypothetical protein
MKPIQVCFALLAIGAAACHGARAAEHRLMPSPQTVHIGDFNAAKKPVLTIDSGDMVTMETASAIIDPAEIDQSGVVPRSAVPEYMRSGGIVASDLPRDLPDPGKRTASPHGSREARPNAGGRSPASASIDD